MSRIAEGGARTYNQIHLPRKYTGKRRVSIYWTWSYPWESNRDVAELDNRFSTMTEVRRVAWPQYETSSGVQPNSSKESPARSSYSMFPRSTSRSWSEKSLTILSPCFSALIRRDLRCRLMKRFSQTRTP